jgi:hypothetical protein
MRQTAGSRPSMRSSRREGGAWPPARRRRVVRYASQGLGPPTGRRRIRGLRLRKASLRPFLAGAVALLLLVPVAWWSMSTTTGSALGSAVSTTQAGMWSPTGAMQTARDHHSATSLLDGTVLVTGGFVGTQFPDPDSTDSAELYDPSTGTWSATGSMANPRAGATEPPPTEPPETTGPEPTRTEPPTTRPRQPTTTTSTTWPRPPRPTAPGPTSESTVPDK